MKAMDQAQLGSWSRAVTCGDGVWLTRKFSPNCTYTVKNYITGALLYYTHICQKGNDDICEGELYGGTSKAAKGFGAEVLFKQMKEDQMNVELHVQDGDSSAGKAILGHFPNCEIVQCGNHFAKNHKKRLIELKGMKTFDDKMINRYEVSSEQIKIKCHCEKRHRKGCGCFDDDFVRKAAACFKQSLSSAGMDSRAFADNLMNVATKHYRGIHEWDGGHCDFHRLMVCSCGSCSDPDNSAMESHTKASMS